MVKFNLDLTINKKSFPLTPIVNFAHFKLSHDVTESGQNLQWQYMGFFWSFDELSSNLTRKYYPFV